MSITELINQVQTYQGPDQIRLRAGVDESLLLDAEILHGVILPDDFREFYRFSDGFEATEDLFNLISLDEIIENKKHDKKDPLYIAEYMIYSDMWCLEVNPDDRNDYKIIIEANYNKLVLTNSFAEFISRFLAGGVFGFDGLYSWGDEINAKLYGNTDPLKIKPLLWVYRECLKRGLMTREGVVVWADRIIATEEGPHQFFIEMSLSRDLNELITILHSIYITDEILQVRAFFSMVYTKLLADQITTDRAMSILADFSRDERFTAYERNAMMNLVIGYDDLNDAMPDKQAEQELHEQVKDFFSRYSNFNLGHIERWGKTNTDLVRKFEDMDSRVKRP